MEAGLGGGRRLGVDVRGLGASANGDVVPNMVGNEYDRVTAGVPTPGNIQVIAHSPVDLPRASTPTPTAPGTPTPSGAGVFSAGTFGWEPLLDDACPNGVTPARRAASRRSPRTSSWPWRRGPPGRRTPVRSNLARLGITQPPDTTTTTSSTTVAPTSPTSRPTATSRSTVPARRDGQAPGAPARGEHLAHQPGSGREPDLLEQVAQQHRRPPPLGAHEHQLPGDRTGQPGAADDHRGEALRERRRVVGEGPGEHGPGLVLAARGHGLGAPVATPTGSAEAGLGQRRPGPLHVAPPQAGPRPQLPGPAPHRARGADGESASAASARPPRRGRRAAPAGRPGQVAPDRPAGGPGRAGPGSWRPSATGDDRGRRRSRRTRPTRRAARP